MNLKQIAVELTLDLQFVYKHGKFRFHDNKVEHFYDFGCKCPRIGSCKINGERYGLSVWDKFCLMRLNEIKWDKT